MEDTKTRGVQYWLSTIASYEKQFQSWERRVQKVTDWYLDNKSLGGLQRESQQAQFNILWSNIQTMMPAVFSRVPQPDVSRRFKDTDPVGRVASLLLERVLAFELEHYTDYVSAMRSAVLDRFIGARGVCWVRYEPHFKSPEQDPVAGVPVDPPDGEEVTEDVDEPVEVIDYECSPVDYIHWRDFGHSIARTWEEVTAVWRRVYMGRKALVERFGEKLGNTIPLDTRPEEEKIRNVAAYDGGDGEQDYQACVYEIWDKESGRALWISKSLGKILDEKQDPLELEGFWPLSRPLYGTLSNDTLVPVPDFVFYQSQAEELDTLADRIQGLTKALQVRGVYNASVEALGRLFSEGTNLDMIPVDNWQAFAEKQGLKGAIDLVDLKPIYEALLAAYDATEKTKNIIYEITGLPDIIRGTNDPSATATAERTKGQFGSLRLRDRQKEVGEFAAQLLRIKAQIICTKYQDTTIAKMGGAEQLSQADQMLVPQALMLLRDNPARAFRIDIEADSMVHLDEQMEQESRIQFLDTVGGFLQKAANAPPTLAPLLGEMLKYMVTGFKAGKQLEGTVDQAIDMLKQQTAQNAQNPPPNPEMLKIQADAQAVQMKVQADTQALQMKLQADSQYQAQELQLKDQMDQRQAQREMQLEQWKQEMQAREVQHQNQLEAQRAELDGQRQAAIEQMKLDQAQQLAAIKDQFDRWKTDQDNATKVIVAQISAKASADTASIGANASMATAEKASESTRMAAEAKAKPERDTDAVKASLEALTAELTRLNTPRTIKRGPNGAITFQ